jgi:hypothetical protein
VTREEAIHELFWIREDENDLKGKEALEMAIKALEQEQKTGEWIFRKNPNLGKCMQEVRECSACGRVFCDHIEPYKNFCGFCGAKMEVNG